MTKKDVSIEDACAAVASATAKLIEAICKSAIHHVDERSDDCSMTNSNDNARRFALRRADGSGGSVRELSKKSRTEKRLYVYMAGARGLATIAGTHGPQIMNALALDKQPYISKIGTTTLSLEARLRQIGQDRYGAAIRTSKGVEIEGGFTAWIAHTITTSRKPTVKAIHLLPRAIAVDLPPGMTRRVFDASLHRALNDRSLDGVSPSLMPRRLVAYDLGDMRVGPAREFYAMSPHDPSDGDRLLSAIEDILQDFRMKRV